MDSSRKAIVAIHAAFEAYLNSLAEPTGGSYGRRSDAMRFLSLAAETLELTPIEMKRAAVSWASRRKAEGICEECERMPTGTDGRAAFCKEHRT